MGLGGPASRRADGRARYAISKAIYGERHGRATCTAAIASRDSLETCAMLVPPEMVRRQHKGSSGVWPYTT